MSRTSRQSRSHAAVLGLPARRATGRFGPSGRSIVVGLIIAAVALLAYLAARETSVFAVRTIEVEGAPPGMARRVQEALRPVVGRSLLQVNGGRIAALATALPGVAGVTYDRAFPNTLRVQVEPERPLAVVRHGVEAWLLSRRGRVMARIAQHTYTRLPRVWLPKSVDVALGETLATGAGSEEVAALAPVADTPLVPRVTGVQVVGDQYVYVLRGGLQLRVGRATDLALKLAIARQILGQTAVHGYLDVSVVERPVAGPDPQVSG